MERKRSVIDLAIVVARSIRARTVALARGIGLRAIAVALAFPGPFAVSSAFARTFAVAGVRSRLFAISSNLAVTADLAVAPSAHPGDFRPQRCHLAL